MACLAVVRVRGGFRARGDVQETLRLLKLHRTHHAILIPDTPAYRGMLQTIAHFVTWGEVDPATLNLLLQRRGRGRGGRRLTEDYLKSHVGYASFDELAKALHEEKTHLNELEGITPVFRLAPPSKGYPRKLKRHYRDKGEYGYRGEAMNLLLSRMC